jgi:hypothetical protein
VKSAARAFEKTRMDDPDIAEAGLGSFACDIRHGREKAELADGPSWDRRATFVGLALVPLRPGFH